jgi:23S rRNA pseudouridine2605 synthase
VSKPAAPRHRSKGAGAGTAQRGERLQKVLARVGLGSRREIEAWIAAGRVRVNGACATLGIRVSAGDRIEVNGRRLEIKQLAAPPQRVLAYHKRAGEVVTRSDPQARTSIFEHLPGLRQGRWIAIGRLDLNTAGLILLTTDGELAHRLMHPATAADREYAVRVLGPVVPKSLDRLRQGVELDDGPAHFSDIVDSGGEGANHWYHVVLQEGRHREVRRLWESQGVKVSRLIRVRFGPIVLDPSLRSGHWRELNPDEVKDLLRLAGIERSHPARGGTRPLKNHGQRTGGRYRRRF